MSFFLFNCSLNLITFRPHHLEDTPELMTLPKSVALIAKFHSCSRSISSTLIWLMAAFFQAKQSYGKGIKEIYLRRKHMDREFGRFDSSPVDLKLCDIRIMSVKCVKCLIWLKKVSRIRANSRNVISQIFQTAKFAKVYLAVIFGMHLLRKSSFLRMIFFTVLLLTSCSHIIFGSNLDSLDNLPFRQNSIFLWFG